jgi:hypothetical protein
MAGDVAVEMDVPWCYAGGEESVSGAPLAGASRHGQCPNRVVEARLGDVQLCEGPGVVLFFPGEIRTLRRQRW